MRPPSHREQIHSRGCWNCLYSHIPEYKDHLLCFHGDSYFARPSCVRDYWSQVELDGRDLCCVEGEDFDKVWGGRVVNPDDVCDEWEAAKAAGGV